jgi:RNA polymerase sigma-70 factor (ECF subfamily)
MTAKEFNKQLLCLEGMLSSFALKLTANKEDANDLLQDTFLSALTHREQFEDLSNMKAWACTIMRNTFINNYRKNKRQSTFCDSTKDLFFLEQDKENINVDPESAICEKEINAAIDNLDSKYKVPFMMYHQGYKYKEISDMLGLKMGTVKSRIFCTRKKMAESLEGYL